MSITHLLVVGLGGALGSMLRMSIAWSVPAGKLPWGTLLANLLGSLVIGVVLGRLGESGAADQPHWHAFAAIGFCGGFTTFSSFSWQTLEQLRQGQFGTAVVHVLASVLLCLLMTWLGWRLGRLWVGAS